MKKIQKIAGKTKVAEWIQAFSKIAREVENGSLVKGKARAKLTAILKMTDAERTEKKARAKIAREKANVKKIARAKKVLRAAGIAIK
jgi:hypothetical protein